MKAHYEEYNYTLGQIPFVLNDNLKRTSNLRSENMNWHENIEIQYCKAGEGVVLIDGKHYDFKAGDIAVIDSNSIHYTYSDTSMIYSCIIVGTEFCKQMGIDYSRLSFPPLFKNRKIADIFEEICKEYKEKSELRVYSYVNNNPLGIAYDSFRGGMVLGTFIVGVGGDIASQIILDGKSFGDVNLASATLAGVTNAGLALIGKGLSIIDKMLGLSTAESIVFGALTNSPLLALGMAINLGISQYAPVYKINN